jgi:xanthine/CO dehydrogenase XdhC/CoxF family maturation factor
MTIQALLDATSKLRAAREPFLIATVVGVRGSAYRRPGARMLVTRERWIAGSVSGGCLEGDLVHKGFWRIADGRPAIVTYDSRDDDDAVGCNGAVDVLLELATDGPLDPLGLIRLGRESQQRIALATVIRGDVGGRVALVGDGAIYGNLADPAVHARACEAVRSAKRTQLVDDDLLVEIIEPPPRLFILGGGHDAVPLAALARAVGWDVMVCLPHARPVARERFRDVRGYVFGDGDDIRDAIDASYRAFAVVMNHQFEQDKASLAALVGSRAAYIGMLGPRHRTVKMLAELGIAGDARLHAPVGLALGAETPEEIALAIVAEVQAVRMQAAATRLRDHAGPIHIEQARKGDHHDDRRNRISSR